jgi:hypothetical protein
MQLGHEASIITSITTTTEMPASIVIPAGGMRSQGFQP